MTWEPRELRTLRKTASACPAQWEGETTDGKSVYVRYRFGHLTAGVGDTMHEAVMDDGFSKHVGNPLDGFMDEADMLFHTGLHWVGDEAAAFRDELEAVVAALVLFAPSREMVVVPFEVAYARACDLLYERGVRMSENDVRRWIDQWQGKGGS